MCQTLLIDIPVKSVGIPLSALSILEVKVSRLFNAILPGQVASCSDRDRSLSFMNVDTDIESARIPLSASQRTSNVHKSLSTAQFPVTYAMHTNGEPPLTRRRGLQACLEVCPMKQQESFARMRNPRSCVVASDRCDRKAFVTHFPASASLQGPHAICCLPL